MRYLLVGVVATFVLIISFNFVAVNVFDTTAFIPLGPLFILPFVGATAYAITRYRLMDIRFVVVKSVLFSLLVGTFFLLYGLLIWIATRAAVARGVTLTPATHALAAIAVTGIAIIGFQWYRELLQRLTDQVFFKARYDARRTLLDLGQKLSETIDFDQILSLLTRTLHETVKVGSVVVYLREAEKGLFRPAAHVGGNYVSQQATIAQAHAIVAHLAHAQGPLVRDELALFLERPTRLRSSGASDGQEGHDAEEIGGIRTLLIWLNAALVLPLVVKGDLTGMVFLGDKLSGDPFSAEDLELLAIVAPQAATALENARLYREAAEFGRTLEREVAHATEELRVANKQLADIDKSKSEFLSVASHQLYTPLTAIRGYLSMIKEGDFGKVPANLTPSLQVIHQSSERLIDLIKNLLDISRIESGRLELAVESVDLAAMARELVTELKPNAEKKKLRFTFAEPPAALPHVVADQQRLRQVLLNTVDNAIKYTERGEVAVQVTEKGDDLVYRVRDTGRGMSKEGAGKLFAKFTRVDTAKGVRVEGLGLGLYVARQMIREIGGDIWAESPGEGKGSTFFVRLPIEGSAHALRAGTKLTVGIKAAEAGEKAV